MFFKILFTFCSFCKTRYETPFYLFLKALEPITYLILYTYLYTKIVIVLHG